MSAIDSTKSIICEKTLYCSPCYIILVIKEDGILKNTLMLFSAIVLLSACTSATKEKVNPAPKSSPVIATTTLQADNGLKRLIAIGRFSDESKRGSSFFVDNNNNRLGKQAGDILSARLAASGKFILLERADVGLVNDEKKLSGDSANLVGAKYILVGSISEFGRETTSEVGVFSRNKIQKATATVNVRLVDIETSEVIYSEEATGQATAEANRVFGVGETAAYNTALDDKAISAAISKLVANVMNNLLDEPWQSFILGQENGQLIIAGGNAQGLKQGTVLNVYEPGKSVTNPQTGKQIELPGKNVGKIEIELTAGQGDDEISFAKIISGQVDSAKLATYRIREG